MSWDVVLFNSPDKIDFETFDEESLQPIRFHVIFEKHFPGSKKDDDHGEITGKDFSIDYYFDEEPVTNTLLNLYGENGLYELVILAKKYGWQIFDTGNEQWIDLDDPAKNGYMEFQKYREHVLNGLDGV